MVKDGHQLKEKGSGGRHSFHLEKVLFYIICNILSCLVNLLTPYEAHLLYYACDLMFYSKNGLYSVTLFTKGKVFFVFFLHYFKFKWEWEHSNIHSFVFLNLSQQSLYFAANAFSTYRWGSVWEWRRWETQAIQLFFLVFVIVILCTKKQHKHNLASLLCYLHYVYNITSSHCHCCHHFPTILTHHDQVLCWSLVSIICFFFFSHFFFFC